MHFISNSTNFYKTYLLHYCLQIITGQCAWCSTKSLTDPRIVHLILPILHVPMTTVVTCFSLAVSVIMWPGFIPCFRNSFKSVAYNKNMTATAIHCVPWIRPTNHNGIYFHNFELTGRSSKIFRLHKKLFFSISISIADVRGRFQKLFRGGRVHPIRLNSFHFHAVFGNFCHPTLQSQL